MRGSKQGSIINFNTSPPESDLYIVGSDGGGLRSIVTSPELLIGLTKPAWSPDGRQLAFSAGSGPGTYDIFLVNTDGTGLHQITFGGSDECPAWSPDDSKIVFDSGRLGPVTLYALFVMDSDGANQRSLVTDGHRNECADWSPDGTKLIFSRDTDSVAVMNADGSALSTVVSNVWAAPIWSPDGTKIAYNGYIANPDGSDATYTSSAVWQPLVSFAFTGFFAPIANLPAVNVARAGSAIPVIFGLGGDFGLNIFVAGSPYTRQVSCSTGEPMDDVEETVSAGNSSLSYDQATEKYTYVWKTSRSWRRPAASWSSGSRTGLST